MSHNHTESLKLKDNFYTFYIGFDLCDDGYGQLKDKFYDELFDDIPAFAFGESVMNKKVADVGIMPTVREAMKKIYSIKEIQDAREKYSALTDVEDKYIKRGEFGELLLYHLLHEYFSADALISKIYFKDSAGSVAHGFDAVHVNADTKTLWLGESKLYIDGSVAIKELAKDVFNHFTTDFLDSEFQIITNRLSDSNDKHDEFILKLLNPKTRNLRRLADIKICLFAGFESKSLKNFDKDNFNQELSNEVLELYEKMNKSIEDHHWRHELDIYLLLFPYDNKREFVSSLHKKLIAGQSI